MYSLGFPNKVIQSYAKCSRRGKKHQAARASPSSLEPKLERVLPTARSGYCTLVPAIFLANFLSTKNKPQYDIGTYLV